MDFPGGSTGNESSCKAGDPGSIPESESRRNRLPTPAFLGFSGGSDSKDSTCNERDLRFKPLVGKIPWRRAWQLNPVFFPGKSPWTEESSRVRHD